MCRDSNCLVCSLTFNCISCVITTPKVPIIYLINFYHFKKYYIDKKGHLHIFFLLCTFFFSKI